MSSEVHELALSQKRAELFSRMLQKKGIQARRGQGLPRRAKDQPVPLSFAQSRLWFLHQLEPENFSYNLPINMRLTGPLDVDALVKTLKEVVRRHEVLRTTFAMSDGQPVQLVGEAGALRFPVFDLSGLDESRREAEAAQIINNEGRYYFDLSREPSLRACLIRLRDDEHIVSLTIHHIVSDGWSTGVLVRELETLYEAFSKGRRSPLPELPIQYGDYAVWQRENLQAEAITRQLEYWKSHLAEAPTVLELPTDWPRPQRQSFRGARKTFALPHSLTEKLKLLSSESDATLFMLLLAAFQVLLMRYTGQQRISVGSPIAGRNHVETEGLIGLFANTLVMHTNLSGDPSFAELLERVRETCIGAYANQDVPFERLVEELHPERSLSHSPLFQVMFVLQNAPRKKLEIEGLRLEAASSEGETANFDLTLSMIESDRGLKATFEYSTDLFAPQTVERMSGHLRCLLESIVRDPGQQISRLSLLTEAEEQQIECWNSTTVEYAGEQCLHQFFEVQAASAPERTALVFGHEQISYRELDEWANQLARHLRELGVGPEVLVGILMDRSPQMLTALLAVLKAGGAYVPLDPAYPRERLAWMLEDAAVTVLLTEAKFVDDLPAHRARVVSLDSEKDVIARQSKQRLGIKLAPENLAYVIYTSGSTGWPKGVAIAHQSAAALIHWAQQYFDMRDLDGMLASTSICFDLSVFELFLPLSVGGKIVLAEDALALPLLPARDEVRLVNTVPSAFSELLRGDNVPHTVRTVCLAGEPLSTKLAQQVYQRPHIGALYNLYGPSEDTTYSTGALIPRDSDKPPAIGNPIANTKAHVLDKHLQRVPVGVPGDLYLSGMGLARCYLNRPDLTAEKFIPDPLSDEKGGRLYATGDRARYRADGEIEYLGRTDQQVKIRGFRIEMGEIEAALHRHAEISEAIVVAREDKTGEKRLVAYLVPKEPGASPSVTELRRHLQQQLPAHMTPSAFVMLSEFPQTPNGKIDRRALPAPDGVRPDLENRYIAPRTELEREVAAIWKEVLHVERIGIHDNFFDLGGHSLLATQVMSRVREYLNVDVALRSLFETPTVEGLAQAVGASRATQAGSQSDVIQNREGNEDLPLSFAQQRLWFLDQLKPNNPFYNIVTAVRLSGLLDVAALRRSVNEIVQRHETLRTTFTIAGGLPVQVVSAEATLVVPLTDLSEWPEAARTSEVRRLVKEESGSAFDLVQGPLLRVSVVRLDEYEHVVLLAMHHIISDGWSMGVLVRELTTLYLSFAEARPSPLSPLPIQYADFAQWQRQWLTDEVLEKQLAYWERQLAGVSILQLPTDHPHPAIRSYHGAFHSFSLAASLSDSLVELSRSEDATLFMTLLAAFMTLLHRYTEQDDVVVGTPIAGRNRKETEGLIGFFVNTLVLRSEVSGDLSFRELLARVRETSLAAYEHQDLPFEMLVEKLQPERSLSHTPLFQVMFVLQGMTAAEVELPGVSVSRLPVESSVAKFDLTLGMEQSSNGLRGSFEYSTDLFEAATVARMAAHLEALLEGIILDPDQRLSELPLLTAVERRRLLPEQSEQNYASEKCLPDLFAENAVRAPEAIALVYENERITYGALNARANQLARYLQSLGVEPEAVVGVCVERSPEMIVALLGILKAGAAYLPLDPAYPRERLAFMLEDAGVPVLLTQSGLIDVLPRYDGSVLCLDTEWDVVAKQSSDNPSSAALPHNLAYVIYTSGSTGKPKGVLVSHANVMRLFAATQSQFSFNEHDVWTLFHSYAFDFSVWELWGALLYGGRLVIVPYLVSRTPEAFYALLKEQHVTVLNQTPSAFRQLSEVATATEEKLDLRLVIFGGEALEFQSLQPWVTVYGDELPQLINMYGITETTVHVTYRRVRRSDIEDAGGSVVGPSISDLDVYVLDRQMQPMPIGVAGEMYVGGNGVARGYLGRPETTAEKFVPQPYSHDPGARLYKTGDRARYRANGDLEYLGRIDHQVKIRGFRIELGEIEAVLLEHDHVAAAIVVAHVDNTGHKNLRAYVVSRANVELSASELRPFLKDKLPEYMVPQAFIFLDALPLTNNGKVHRDALPDVAGARMEKQYVPPQTEMEKLLAVAWAETLRLERVGLADNFFELGGDSIRTIQLRAKAQQLGVDFSIQQLFQHQTVQELAQALSAEQQKTSHLVEIQSRGSKPAFYCVHPASGNVLCFRDLARHLDSEQPFYAFQAQGLNGGQSPIADVKTMATAYVEELLQTQPADSYLLGGYSMGGVVAFEMAQQLQARGKTMSLLVLLDTKVPQGDQKFDPEDETSLMISFAREMGVSLASLDLSSEELLNLDPDQRLLSVFAQAQQHGLLPSEIDQQQIHDLWRVFKTNAIAARAYVPEIYQGKITLLNANGNNAGRENNGWRRLAADGIDVKQVPGDHFSIVREPYVKLLGELLSASIAEAVSR